LRIQPKRKCQRRRKRLVKAYGERQHISGRKGKDRQPFSMKPHSVMIRGYDTSKSSKTDSQTAVRKGGRTEVPCPTNS